MPARVVVSAAGEDHSSLDLPEPTLTSLTEAVSDLYDRMGCEAPGKEVRLEVLRPFSSVAIYAPDPEAAPEEIAALLWAALQAAET